MPGIVFHFEPFHVDVFSGKDVILDAWNYAIKAAGDIDRCVIIDTSSEARALDQDVPTEIYQHINQWDWGNDTITILDVPWSQNPGTSLWDFNHQTDWYLFGPANGWTDTAGLVDQVIHVPQAGHGALHSVHIASIVMAHRYSVIGGG